MSTSLKRVGFAAELSGAVVCLMLAVSAVSSAADPALVKTIVNEQTSAEAAAKQTQDKVNQLDDQTKGIVGEYRQALQETATLKRYNEQLALQIKSQEQEMVQIAKELEEIETTSREIVPLLQKMLDTLDQFVKLDMPFLPQERASRVAQLKEMMGRADVSLSEKYRRIVEAYQVEMEYGRTLEPYDGKVGDKTVQFLRIGRVALLYQTLDGGETGYYDVTKKDFVKDNSYKDSVRAGLKVAKKQSAPDLLIVPVAAPKEVK